MKLGLMLGYSGGAMKLPVEKVRLASDSAMTLFGLLGLWLGCIVAVSFSSGQD